MESCGVEGGPPRARGVTGADAEVGALVWVVRRNGRWWPGQILSADELPANCFPPPRSTGTPVRLLGCSAWMIDWYNLEKSKRVKPFRCGEFDECIENAKVRASLQKVICSKGKNACIESAIVHALEIEGSRFAPEVHLNTHGSCASPKRTSKSKDINQIIGSSKEGTSSFRDHRDFKIKIISIAIPTSKESNKSDENVLPQEYEGTTECQAPDSDAFGLDARVEGAACEPTEVENNAQAYDVKLSILGNYTGHGLPLACLLSTSTGKPIKGYSVDVKVVEDGYSAAYMDGYLAAISSLEHLSSSKIQVPRQPRSAFGSQSKRDGHKKINEHDLEKSWSPYIKKPAQDASPRKMQKLSSCASSWRECANMTL